MNTAIDHERERAEAIDKDGLQRTTAQEERQEFLNARGISQRRQHARRDELDQGMFGTFVEPGLCRVRIGGREVCIPADHACEAIGIVAEKVLP